MLCYTGVGLSCSCKHSIGLGLDTDGINITADSSDSIIIGITAVLYSLMIKHNAKRLYILRP